MSKEPKGWITVKGNHIPIYDGESKTDALQRFYDKKEQKKSVAVGDKDVKVSQRKPRVDPDDVTDERIMDEIAGKDSYANSEEYKKLEKQSQEAWRKFRKAQDERRKLEKDLEKEASPKPKEEWTSSDEITAMLFGDKEVVQYSKKGDQINEKIKQLEAEEKDWQQKWDESTKAMKEMDQKQVLKQQSDYLKNLKPGDISSDVKEDYFGFSKKTTVSRVDDMLESGKATIVEMSPKTYLQECAYSIFKDYDATLETQLHATPADNVRDLMIKMQSGVKMHLPYLDYETDNQEGRNRAVAAYLLGIEKIPVAIIKRRR